LPPRALAHHDHPLLADLIRGRRGMASEGIEDCKPSREK
jgi:hypothetical protein